VSSPPIGFGGFVSRLAHQISGANLGCDAFYLDPQPADRTFAGSQDEGGCRVGANAIVIASFADLRAADASIRNRLCSPSSPPNANRVYLRGDHWIIYPSSASVLGPIRSVVGGSTEHACG
jgi:hypothetical protein